MAKLASEGSKSMTVRSLAVTLTRRLQQKDYGNEACSCLAYCRDHIRYVRDIRDTETLHYPQAVISIGSGDCDDKSILLASLLYSIGHQVRFIAVAFAPGAYSHVWVQDNVNGQWLDLEPTEPLECGKRIPSQGAVSYLYRDLDQGDI